MQISHQSGASKTNPEYRNLQFLGWLIPLLLLVILLGGLISWSLLVVRAEIEVVESLERASITATATEAGGCNYQASIRGYGALQFPIDNDPNPCTKNRMIAWWLQIKQGLIDRLNRLGFNGEAIVQEMQISLLLK
jgi:hypothetical protein